MTLIILRRSARLSSDIIHLIQQNVLSALHMPGEARCGVPPFQESAVKCSGS